MLRHSHDSAGDRQQPVEPKRLPQLPSAWAIVRPDDDEPGLSGRNSEHPSSTRPRKGLRDVWRRYLEPRLLEEGRKPATFRAYQTHLLAWEKYWAEQSKKRPSKSSDEPSNPMFEGSKNTGNSEIAIFPAGPPIQAIRRRHLSEFRLSLMAGRSKVTVNNYLKSIRSLLLEARERGLLSRSPQIKKLKARPNARKNYVTWEDVSAIYRSCSVASWPAVTRDGRRIDPVTFWRAAIVLYFNYGFRTQELIRYETSKRSLQWGNIVFDHASPGVSDLVNESGWLWYTPPKQEGEKPDPLVLAVSPIVREHLRSIRPPHAKPTEDLFPFPFCQRSFLGQWRAIVRAAGVRRKAALEGAMGALYQIKDLRKSCTTYHNKHRAGIAQYIVGHGDRNSISDVHYNSPEEATAEALLSCPQPEAFSEIRRTAQLMLF
jgi:hypothetical protein